MRSFAEGSGAPTILGATGLIGSALTFFF